MPNHGQLRAITPTQETALNALTKPKYAEIVVVYWPSPDGAKAYGWSNLLADPAYYTPLTTWLAGKPFIPAFVAQNENERFHNITMTSAVGDDVVQMSFSNTLGLFEELCYKWRGGVKVEIFYFYPEVTGGMAVSQFLGHLRTPDEIDEDFVQITVANGFRSAYLEVPSNPHASNCTAIFGGEFATVADLDDNPCDYDRHLGGSIGTLNGGSPWTFCEHTKEACARIMGEPINALRAYRGDDAVVDTTLIGAGDHKTQSTTIGNETRLKQPIPVPYGKILARNLHLLRYAKEINPSEDHQDKGTIRAVFEIGEGPIEGFTKVEMIGRNLPRPDGLGLEKRLGTQRQSPTTFSPNVMSYNRRAHFRGDVNPINPADHDASGITAKAEIVGRNTVRVYSSPTSFTRQWTDLRAWCFFDMMSSKNYGFRLDRARFEIDDIIYLAGKGSRLNRYVTQTSVQQFVYDVCLSGRWYLPFYFAGKLRILPIEDVDLDETDIPLFTDTGTGRNIIFDESRGTSTLRASYRDDDKIYNSALISFEDEENEFIERPLTFDNWEQQRRAGLVYGDSSRRKVSLQLSAYGLTNISEVQAFAEYLLSIGEFGSGGILNNLSIEFRIHGWTAEALNLHLNKVIRVLSPKLTKYKDVEDDTFEFFLVKSLEKTPRGELIVKAQAWWYNLCESPGGAASGYVKYPADNPNTVDGPEGVATRVQGIDVGNWPTGDGFPSTLDPDNILTQTWSHTILSLPATGQAYRVGAIVSSDDFLIFPDGSAWVYTASSGILFSAVPPGTLTAGSTVGSEYDKNGGSPIRRYKVNGVTIHTDTASVGPSPQLRANPQYEGFLAGAISWSVTYGGCQSSYFASGVTTGGSTTTSSGGYGLSGYGESYGG